MTTLDNPPNSAVNDRSRSAPEPAEWKGRLPALRPTSPVATYVGIGLSAVGFVLIAFAWGRVAGQTSVALQLPYLVSGAVTGLAVVMVGLTVISVAARRRDAALREQQTELLADALRELALSLEDRRS